MKARRFAKLVLDIRTGFWLRPLLMLTGGAVASVLLTRLDHWMTRSGWTFLTGNVSPGGARALLSVASGALATTLAISLSMTMVTVQLASSQYTPRLLRRFLSDRFTQLVLGAFLATISFQFLVLRAVRSPDEGSSFVPMTSLTVSVVATLVCLALLVVFLHRTMRAMQASTIVATIATESVQAIQQLSVTKLRPVTAPLTGDGQVIRANAAGYIQLLDDRGIRRVLAAGERIVRRDANPGDFVMTGTPLVSIFGGRPLSGAEVQAVRGAFSLGAERTYECDTTFGVRQLVDVALKALSPGINDVTTAVMVVNELGVIAGAVAATGLIDDVARIHVDEHDGSYITRDLSLERYLHLAFDEIVPASAQQPRVHQRILDVLATVEAVEPESQPLLRAFARRLASGELSTPSPAQVAG